VITWLTRNAEETRALGKKLSRALKPGDAVSLTGPLGSGKTCLIQGLVRGLGFHGKVGSPSFVLVTEYPASIPVQHVDLYRLDGPSDLDSLGWEDLFDDHCLTLVEWGEKAEGRFPCSCRIFLEQEGEDERRITVQFEDSERERNLS
jgi:tRNA threonylcarbamoyladenosine biosynthesis protein TsaE